MTDSHPLRRAREDRGLQQQQFAREAGISNALLSMMENSYEGKDETRQRLAALLDKQPWEIWPHLYEPPGCLVVGGPLDGTTRPAASASRCLAERDGGKTHFYVLNGPTWVYQGAVVRSGS